MKHSCAPTLATAPSLFTWTDLQQLEATRAQLIERLRGMRERGHSGEQLRTEGRLREITERIMHLQFGNRRSAS